MTLQVGIRTAGFSIRAVFTSDPRCRKRINGSIATHTAPGLEKKLYPCSHETMKLLKTLALLALVAGCAEDPGEPVAILFGLGISKHRRAHSSALPGRDDQPDAEILHRPPRADERPPPSP